MAPYVVELKENQFEKLKRDLIAQGFSLKQPEHTHFQALKSGISCTLYTSGKLVVQGKNAKEFIEFYLEPELLGQFNLGYEQMKIDFTPRIGVDEAGKGDFFGPLCIAAVYAGEAEINELIKIGVKDSKTIQDKTIAKMALQIKKTVPHHIIRISPRKYNELYAKFHNLNYLLAWSHATAIEALIEKTGCRTVLIDQFTHLPLVEKQLAQKKLEVDFEKRTQGESDIVVAAASILARDAFVSGLDKLSEWLKLELPKGASTKVVQTAKKLLQENEPSLFNEIAKTHFKTMKDLGVST